MYFIYVYVYMLYTCVIYMNENSKEQFQHFCSSWCTPTAGQVVVRSSP